MEDYILDDNLITEEEEAILPRYAGFWIRVIASFLDALILLPLGLFAFFSIIYFRSIPLYVLSLILSGCYKPFCEYNFGATIGKMVIDLKVTDENFQQISLEQSIIRASPFLLSSVASLIFILLVDANFFDNVSGFMEFGAMIENSEYKWLNDLGNWPVFISCIVVAFDSRKQGLHDKLAKTYCVYQN